MAERIEIKNIQESIGKLNEINSVHKNHIKRYQFAASIIKPNSLVVDIACGTGYGSKMIAMNNCTVIGIDISEEALKFCKKYNDHHNISWKLGDITNFANLVKLNVDAIVCFETLEHLATGQKEILNQFKSRLHKNCPAICSIPLNHPDTVWHKKIFSFNERENLFKSVFDKIEYSDINASLVVGWNN